MIPDKLVLTGKLIMTETEFYAKPSSLVLMYLWLSLHPSTSRKDKKSHRRYLEVLAKAATDKGCKNVEKVLFRNTIDEFTYAKAIELDALMSYDECRHLRWVSLEKRGTKQKPTAKRRRSR